MKAGQTGYELFEHETKIKKYTIICTKGATGAINCSTVSRLKFCFCVGAAFGSPQVTYIKTVALTAKGGPYNVKFKLIQRSTGG